MVFNDPSRPNFSLILWFCDVNSASSCGRRMHLDTLVRLQLVNPQQRIQGCEHLPALLLGSFLGSCHCQRKFPRLFCHPSKATLHVHSGERGAKLLHEMIHHSCPTRISHENGIMKSLDWNQRSTTCYRPSSRTQITCRADFWSPEFPPAFRES